MANESRKLGAGHLSAFLRQGLKELRAAVNPSKEGVAQDEIGLYGTATPQEVMEQRDKDAREVVQTRLEVLQSLLDRPLQPPPPQQERTNELSR